MLPDGNFIPETGSEAKTIVSWQKNSVVFPCSRKSYKYSVKNNHEPHRYIAFYLSTKVCLVISEQQTPSLSVHCHLQSPMMEIKLPNSSKIKLLS